LPIVQDHPRPWRRGSEHGPGPRRPLSADQRRIWLARAELERRAGRLTALHVDVGRALLKRLGEDGRCDPAQTTLATDAGCSERTVRRALAALRELGLLAWAQRLVVRPWPAGGRGATRAEQTSNAYALELPAAPLIPALPRRRRGGHPRDCGGQAGRGTSPRLIPIAPPPFDPAAWKALEAIAAARMAALSRAWAERRAM
jgi:Helix-turn-helix domain